MTKPLCWYLYASCNLYFFFCRNCRMEMNFLIKAQINWFSFRITFNRYEYLGLEIINRSMQFRNSVGYLLSLCWWQFSLRAMWHTKPLIKIIIRNIEHIIRIHDSDSNSSANNKPIKLLRSFRNIKLLHGSTTRLT